MLWGVLGQRGRIRSLGWGLADQALSSMTNLALGLLAARSLGPRNFGTFSLVFAIYLAALAASRALNTEPLVVRYSAAPQERLKPATASAAGCAALVGSVLGLAAMSVGIAGGATGTTLVALGLSLPGLLVQDAWRYAFFASGKESRAFVNDLVWAVLLLPLIVLLSVSGVASAALFTLAWGTAATGAAVVGAAQAHVVPKIKGWMGWWKENRHLTPGFFGQAAASNGASTITTFSIAAVAGIEVIGSVRAAEMLIGPLNVLFLGMFLTAPSEGVRLLTRSSAAKLRQWCLLLSTLLPAVAVLWGAMLYLLPSSVGHGLLKSTWAGAAPLIVPLALSRAGQALAFGPETGLRALGAAGRGFYARVVAGALWVAGGTIGAAVGGASGAAWGLALSTLVAAVFWWWQLSRSFRAHQESRAATSSGPTTALDNPSPA